MKYFWKWFLRVLLLSPLILFAVFWLDYRLHSPDFFSDAKVLGEYQPDPVIAEIAEKTTMTEKGKAIFYRGNPEILDEKEIDYFCGTDKVGYIRDVDGCFGSVAHKGWFSTGRGHGIPISVGGIFILKSSPEVPVSYPLVGAHEMLHYAYYRLDDAEREKINKLIEADFQRRQTDKRLVELVEDYRRDSKDVLNELHSLIGTEYKGIDPELENYYKRYFRDRSKVVEL